jgi:hypothetical protein
MRLELSPHKVIIVHPLPQSYINWHGTHSMAEDASPSPTAALKIANLNLPAQCDPPSETNPPKQAVWIVRPASPAKDEREREREREMKVFKADT